MKRNTKRRVGLGLIVAGASIFTGGTGYVFTTEQNWQSDPNVEQFHKIRSKMNSLNNSRVSVREFLEDSQKYVVLQRLYKEMESDEPLMASVRNQERLERNDLYKGLIVEGIAISGFMAALGGWSLLTRKEENENETQN